MDRPHWKSPYTGPFIMATILVALTAMLIADSVKLVVGSSPTGMLAGYVIAAVLSATALSWSLGHAYQAWRQSRNRKVLGKSATFVLILLYLPLAVLGLWMVFFGTIENAPGDIQNGTLVLILATEMMVPLIIISGFGKE